MKLSLTLLFEHIGEACLSGFSVHGGFPVHVSKLQKAFRVCMDSPSRHWFGSFDIAELSLCDIPFAHSVRVGLVVSRILVEKIEDLDYEP